MTEREGSRARVPVNAAPAAAAGSRVSGFLSHTLAVVVLYLSPVSSISSRHPARTSAWLGAITGGICPRSGRWRRVWQLRTLAGSAARSLRAAA